MFIAGAYLIDRLFYRFTQFWVHWYAHSFFIIGGAALRTLEYFDRIFAVRITIRNFSVPLYGDYTTLGRILGFIFRSFRIAIGSVIYAVIAALFLIIYLIWAAIPLYFILKAIYS